MDRFWSKVDRRGPDDCWLWQGALASGGYGAFHVQGNQKAQAHRFAWELANGPMPARLLACHRCDVRLCCNPAHIFPGTAKENTQDAIAKGRFRPVVPKRPQTHCNRGHRFTEETIIRKASGSKSCRICKRAADRRRKR